MERSNTGRTEMFDPGLPQSHIAQWSPLFGSRTFLPIEQSRGTVVPQFIGGLYACIDRDGDPGSVGRVCDVEQTRRGLAARRWFCCGSRATEGRSGPMLQSRWRSIPRQSLTNAGDPRRHDRLHADAGLGAALNRPYEPRETATEIEGFSGQMRPTGLFAAKRIRRVRR
jgi:hypothetical protein